MTTTPDVSDAVEHLIETSVSEPMELRKFYGMQFARKMGLRACRNKDTIICMDPKCQRVDVCQWKRGKREKGKDDATDYRHSA